MNSVTPDHAACAGNGCVAMRIAMADDLLPWLREGYRGFAEFASGKADLVAAFDHEAAEMLGAQRPAAGDRAHARFELAARTFVRDDAENLQRSIVAIETVTGLHRAARFSVEVLLLLPALFHAPGEDPSLVATSQRFLTDFDSFLTGLTRLTGIRIWLVDGQAANGACYDIDDVAGVLREFDPGTFPSDIDPLGSASRVYAFGALAVWFPRHQIVKTLSQRFVLRTLETEPWVVDEQFRVPLPSVATECSSFIEDNVTVVLDQMLHDRTTGAAIIPLVTCPAFSRDAPVSVSLERVHKLIDGLRPQLQGVEQRLVENRSLAATQMSQSLLDRVARCEDATAGHLASAMAFLDVLRCLV